MTVETDIKQAQFHHLIAKTQEGEAVHSNSGISVNQYLSIH